AHAAAASVRQGRLQLPASGPVRRADVPAPADDPVVQTRKRFYGWRVRDDRATTADAVTANRGAASARRSGPFRRESASGAGQPRCISGQASTRCQPRSLGPPSYARGDFPRRHLNDPTCSHPLRQSGGWAGVTSIILMFGSVVSQRYSNKISWLRDSEG